MAWLICTPKILFIGASPFLLIRPDLVPLYFRRDIKPHNFVIDTSTEPAKVKLCDFGLARVKTGTFVETDGIEQSMLEPDTDLSIN